MARARGPRPDFGVNVVLAAVAVQPGELYRRLISVEQHPNYLYPAFGFIDALLDRAVPASILAPSPTDVKSPSEWAERLAVWARAHAQSASTHPLQPANYGRLLITEFAPLGLLDGCWLQGATALSIAESELGVLMQEQHKLRASGQAACARWGRPYRDLFQTAVGRAIECYHDSFVSECGITPHSFEHALAGLCLGLFPLSFMPEIVGYNWWHTCVGSCPQLAPSEGHTPIAPATLREHALRSLALIMAGERSVTDQTAVLERVARGFTLAHEANRRWEAAVAVVASRSGPTEAMLRMLQNKSKFAIGYHKRVRVGGVPLDDYFSRGEAGCKDLMTALAKSRFIAPGKPHESRLLTSSVSLRGPMFEVFSAEEKDVIAQWVRGLEAGEATDQSKPVPPMPDLVGHYVPPQDASDFAAKSAARFGDCDVAELAFYFSNADLHPIIRPHSATIAGRVAAALTEVCSASLPDQSCPPYSLDTLQNILEDLRVRQLQGYENDATPPLAGQALIDAYVSGYPSVCTDGSWLQGCASVAHFHQESNQVLFRIYREENGDGDFESNHNLIGRRLLASMGAQFPPLTQRSFYQPEGARASFFGPCCNLALALNTQRFMPEVLGLNLAIEANGVGWKFRKGSAELRRSGFDPLLMDLHETIDNFASGHTSMSARAIVSYLDRVASVDGFAVQALWQRIWNAYQGVQGLIENRDNPRVQQAITTVARANVEGARNLGGTLIDVVSG